MHRIIHGSQSSVFLSLLKTNFHSVLYIFIDEMFYNFKQKLSAVVMSMGLT